MASNEPQGPRPDATDDSEFSDDPLSRLGERLDRASEAAERLFAQAADRATRKPPPAGWQQPEPDAGDGRRRADSLLAGEVELVLGVLASLRDRIPPELQQGLADALREVLLALRSLIDWYLEHSERRRSEPVEVQDIPIL
jgi:hypothetical protein